MLTPNTWLTEALAQPDRKVATAWMKPQAEEVAREWNVEESDGEQNVRDNLKVAALRYGANDAEWQRLHELYDVPLPEPTTAISPIEVKPTRYWSRHLQRYVTVPEN